MMSIDNKALLRMILYTRAEASMQGFSGAAVHLEAAALGIAELLTGEPRSLLLGDLERDLDSVLTPQTQLRKAKDH
jgi:hypothetical protein